MKTNAVLVATLATLATVAAIPGAAAAQPALTAPGATAPLPPAPAEDGEAEREDGPKSPSTALMYSLGGTAAALALSAAGAASEGTSTGGAMSAVGSLGLWLAPSFGHWYAGNGFTKGLGLRLGGGGVAMVGVIGVVGCAFSSDHEGGSDSDCTIPFALMIGGAGMFVGGAVHDIVTAPREARRYNARHARRHASVQAVPALVSAGGARAPGLGLAGTF